jgi:hypothetical protein
MYKVRTLNLLKKAILLIAITSGITACSWPKAIWDFTFGRLEVKPNEWQDNIEIGPRRAPADNPGSGGPYDQELKKHAKKTGGPYPYPNAGAGQAPMAPMGGMPPMSGSSMDMAPMGAAPMGSPMGMGANPNDPMNPANFPPDPYAGKAPKTAKPPMMLPPPPGKFQPMGSSKYPSLQDNNTPMGDGLPSGGDMNSPDDMNPAYLKHYEDSPSLIRKFEPTAADSYIDINGKVVSMDTPPKRGKKSKSEIAADAAIGTHNTTSMFPLEDYTPPEAKKSARSSSMFPLEEFTPKSSVSDAPAPAEAASTDAPSMDRRKVNTNINGIIGELDKATGKTPEPQANNKKPDVNLDKRIDENNAAALGIVDGDTQALSDTKLTRDIEKVDTKGKKAPIDDIVIGDNKQADASKTPAPKKSFFDFFKKKPAEPQAPKLAEQPKPILPPPAQLAAPIQQPKPQVSENIKPDENIIDRSVVSKDLEKVPAHAVVAPVASVKKADLPQPKTAEATENPFESQMKPAEVATKTKAPEALENPFEPQVSSAEPASNPAQKPVNASQHGDQKPVDLTNNTASNKPAAPKPVAAPAAPQPVAAAPESIKLPDAPQATAGDLPPPPVVTPKISQDYAIKSDAGQTGLLPKPRYADRRRSENF